MAKTTISTTISTTIWGQRYSVRANWAQAGSPIEGSYEHGEWTSTPWQVADFDSPDDALRAYIVADDEEIEIEDPAELDAAIEAATGEADESVAYRVYHSVSNQDRSYCGECDTLEEAQELAEVLAAAGAEGEGAGHDLGGEEDEEPESWHGDDDGTHCVVRVTY